MPQETENIRDYKYRVNFKQSAKGQWQGEFTVRADNLQDLHNEMHSLHYTVRDKLDEMNKEGKENGTNGLETN